MSQQVRFRSSSVVFPLLVIAFGILMLLWRWLPDFDPWPVLGKYWPLFLILVGAGMFWDHSQRQGEPDSAPAFPVGSTIATFVFLLVLAFLLWRGHAFERHGWTSAANNPGHRGHETQVVGLNGARAVRMVGDGPRGFWIAC